MSTAERDDEPTGRRRGGPGSRCNYPAGPSYIVAAIRAEIERQELSVYRLAQLTGVPLSSLQRALHGNPSAAMIDRVIDQLGVEHVAAQLLKIATIQKGKRPKTQQNEQTSK